MQTKKFERLCKIYTNIYTNFYDDNTEHAEQTLFGKQTEQDLKTAIKEFIDFLINKQWVPDIKTICETCGIDKKEIEVITQPFSQTE